MLNFEIKKIVDLHYQLQYGCFFRDVDWRGDKIFGYSDIIESFIWNHIYCYSDNIDADELSHEAVNWFFQKNRQPCIYIDDWHKPALDKLLNGLMFICKDNEAWMRYDLFDSLVVDDACHYDIGIVRSNEDLSGFCAVCTECFDSRHSDCIIREFQQGHPHKTVEHYFVRIDGRIVSIASIYSSGNFFFIHNVGTTANYRKRGIAGSLINYLLKQIKYASNDACVVLQCDGGGYVEEWYKRLGFIVIHRRWGYVYEQK